MVLSKERVLFALDISKLISNIFESGSTCSIGEFYYIPFEVKEYDENGERIINRLNTKKLAIAFYLFSPCGVYSEKPEEYKQFGDYWESLSSKNRWGDSLILKTGGRIMDGGRFEREI